MKRVLLVLAALVFAAGASQLEAQCNALGKIKNVSTDGKLKASVTLVGNDAYTATVSWGNLPAGSSMPSGSMQVNIGPLGFLKVLSTLPAGFPAKQVLMLVDSTDPSQPYVELSGCTMHRTK